MYPHLARSPVGLAHDVRVPGVEERAQRERGDILAGKRAGLEPRLRRAGTIRCRRSTIYRGAQA
jgi:hypothetical protein